MIKLIHLVTFTILIHQGLATSTTATTFDTTTSIPPPTLQGPTVAKNSETVNYTCSLFGFTGLLSHLVWQRDKDVVATIFNDSGEIRYPEKKIDNILATFNNTNIDVLSTLSISNVSCVDAAVYVCAAFNVRFEPIWNTSKTLHVTYDPEIHRVYVNKSPRQAQFNTIEKATCEADVGQPAQPIRLYLYDSSIKIKELKTEVISNITSGCMQNVAVTASLRYNATMANYTVKCYVVKDVKYSSELGNHIMASPSPYKLYQAQWTCPGRYRTTTHFKCIHIERQALTWPEARRTCSPGHLISMNDWSPFKQDDLFETIWSREIAQKFWTSLRNRNNRLVWETSNISAPSYRRPFYDNIYPDLMHEKFYTIAFRAFLSANDGCGKLTPRVTPMRRKRQGSNNQFALDLVDCSEFANPICTVKPMNLTLQNSAVAGCKSTEYSNDLTTNCFILHEDTKCLNNTCIACPEGYDIFSPRNSADHLFMIHASVKFQGEDFWLGIKSDNPEVMKHVQNGEQFSLRDFTDQDTLREFIVMPIYGERMTNNVCLYQNKWNYNWANCSAKGTYTVCSRKKSPLGDMAVTMKMNDENIESFQVHRYKSAEIYDRLRSIRCEARNARETPVLLRNGIGMDVTNPLFQDSNLIVGCYECALWSNKTMQWLRTEKLCLDRSDALRFTLEIKATFNLDIIKALYLLYVRSYADDKYRNLEEALFSGLRTSYPNSVLYLSYAKNASAVSFRNILKFIYTINVPTDELKAPQIYREFTSELTKIFQNFTEQFNKELEENDRTQGRAKRGGILPSTTSDAPDLSFLQKLEFVNIFNTDFCLGHEYQFENGTIRIGDVPAPVNATESTWTSQLLCETDKKPLVSASCLGSIEEGVRYRIEEHEDCLSLEMFTKRLEELHNMTVNETNVGEIIRELNKLVVVKIDLDSTDIIFVSDILQKAVSVHLSGPIGEDFCSIYSSLLKTSSFAVEEANENTNFTNKLIATMDQFTQNVDIYPDDRKTYSYDNLVVELIDLVDGEDVMTSSTYESNLISGLANQDSPLVVSGIPKNASNISVGIYLPQNSLKKLLESR